MWLFVLFLAVPLIEIGLFVQVGGAIGLWPTLAIVVLTAFLGTQLMRAQGMLAMGQIRESFGRLSDPTEPLAHGAMILFSGALLLTPGFFTDTVGFALLVPAVRRAVFHWARQRVHVAGGAHFGQAPFEASSGGWSRGSSSERSYERRYDARAGSEDIIEGEFQDVTQKPVSPSAGRLEDQ